MQSEHFPKKQCARGRARSQSRRSLDAGEFAPLAIASVRLKLNSIQFLGTGVIAARIGTRERLIRAAQEELIQGHGLLEMQAVAKRARVSVGLAYHHFGSKAGLIAAVVEAFYDRLEEAAFNPANLTQDWAGREKERIAAYISFHYDHPFAPLVVGPLSRAAEVLDVEQAFTRRQLAAGAHNLRAGQREGVIPADLDPRLAIALMIGGIHQALIGALTKSPRPDRDELTEKIWVFVAAALRLPPGRRALECARQRREPNPCRGGPPWPIRTSSTRRRPATARPICSTPAAAAISGPAMRSCPRRRC